MKRILGFLLISSLMVSPAFANGDWWDKGNGGFVVLCENGSKQTFDLYELQSRYQNEMTLDTSESLSLEGRLEYLFSKISRLNPTRAAKYHQWFEEFFNEAQFIEGTIHPLPDIGFGGIPETCSLKVAIYQHTPDILNKKRYLISQVLWEGLDINNKAALILHELIYREAREASNHHVTSERSRYLNAWFHSKEFLSTSLMEYLTGLQDLHFQDADYGPHKIALGSYIESQQEWQNEALEFYDSGAASTISINSYNALAFKFVSPLVETCLTNNADSFRGRIMLGDSGALNSFAYSLNQPGICSFTIQNRVVTNSGVQGFDGEVFGTDFHFFQNGLFEVQGIHYPGYRFFFNGFRFETISAPVKIKFQINQEQVVKIEINNARACRVSNAHQIRFYSPPGESKTLLIDSDSVAQTYTRLPYCE
jgi:hypothetical protein